MQALLCLLAGQKTPSARNSVESCENQADKENLEHVGTLSGRQIKPSDSAQTGITTGSSTIFLFAINLFVADGGQYISRPKFLIKKALWRERLLRSLTYT